MYNILLDKLPDNYKGYLIRTDFRIGIQIYNLLNDESISDEEKCFIALSLLYGNGIPRDTNIAMEGLEWFLNLGKLPDKKRSSKSVRKETPIMDFEIDSSRIFSGFKKKLGVELNKVKMHWFEFRYLLLELNDCHLSDVVEIRSKEITPKMPAKQRLYYTKLKKLYAINDNTGESMDTQKQLFNYLHSK